MKARRPEDKLSDEVRVALGALPSVIVMVNKVTYGRRKGSTHDELLGLGEGTPDLIVIVAGVLLGLELKTAEGRLSEKQKAVRAAWGAAGALYLVARSVDEALDHVANVAAVHVWCYEQGRQRYEDALAGDPPAPARAASLLRAIVAMKDKR